MWWQNTIGVATVVDELAVVKDVKVIPAKPAGRVIESVSARRVIESKPAELPKTEVDVEPDPTRGRAHIGPAGCPLMFAGWGRRPRLPLR